MQLFYQGKGLLKVHFARLEQEVQGGLGFQLGMFAVLNLVVGCRREAPRWGQTPFFSLENDLGCRGRFQPIYPVCRRPFQTLL